VPWLRRSVSGLSPRRPGFDIRSVRVRFAVDEVAPVQVLLRVHSFPCQCLSTNALHSSPSTCRLLTEGTADKVWIFSKNNLSEMGEHRAENYFHTFKVSSQHCEKRLWASSCLSVCPHGTTRLIAAIFMQFDMNIFRKSLEKIQASLKISQQKRVPFWRSIYTFDHKSFPLLIRNIWHKICRDNQNTYLMFINFFLISCLYGITRKNILQTGRQATDGNITEHVRNTCWVTMASNMLAEYVISFAFPLQNWLRERASMLDST
jgi:hypothetical protein